MISPWLWGIQIMFKFTILTFAGNTTLSVRTEEKIREYMTDRARVYGEREYSVQTIDVPASWLLMIHFGWQGGTIHQVAESTGLSTSEILELDQVVALPSKLDGMNDYHMGYHAGHITADSSITRGNVQYWRGVCEHVRMYRTAEVYKMYMSNN